MCATSTQDAQARSVSGNRSFIAHCGLRVAERSSEAREGERRGPERSAAKRRSATDPGLWCAATRGWHWRDTRTRGAAQVPSAAAGNGPLDSDRLGFPLYLRSSAARTHSDNPGLAEPQRWKVDFKPP
eukprot:6935105-Prymnesium_polylepis.1